MARYQYGTSPRKIEPDYTPHTKKAKIPQKKQVQTKKQQIRKDVKKKVKAKNAEKRRKVRIIGYVAIAFGILLAISYRNSLITENFTEVRNLKTELSAIQKENEQLEVNIESSINLQNIEKEATEQLGMQKLTQGQKVYIELPKKDYVEPATEQIEMGEKQNILEKILSFFQVK